MKTLLRCRQTFGFGILLAITLAAANSHAQSNSLTVSITTPTNGAVFSGPTNIEIIAVVPTTNDTAAFVEFFDGVQPLGVVSNFAIVDPGGPGINPRGGRAYFLTWSNPPAGVHSLTAAAVDTNGISFSSPPVSVTIDQMPSIAFASPAPGSGFPFHAAIPIDVSAIVPSNYQAEVSVSAEPFPIDPFGPGLPVFLGTKTNYVSNPPYRDYLFTWSNAPAATYRLTASAVFTLDNTGLATRREVTETIIVSTSTNPPPQLLRWFASRVRQITASFARR